MQTSAPTHPPGKFHIALRLYLCLSTLSVANVTLNSPDSLNGRLLEAAGIWGDIITWMLVLAAFVGLVDLVINDWLPARWVLPWAQRYRHVGYLGIAAGAVSYVFVMTQTDNLTLLAVRYVLDGAFCCWVACQDVVYRMRAVDAGAAAQEGGP